MKQWGELAVEGHFTGPTQWLSYHRLVSAQLARVVGALASEVVAMNTLSVNLHLMMVSFYRPTTQRPVILMEAGAFPTDRHAVEAQIRFHGFDPAECLVEVQPDEANGTISLNAIERAMTEHGPRLALVLWPGVQYRTGQAFDLDAITAPPACRAHASASTWRTRSATCRCACMTWPRFRRVVPLQVPQQRPGRSGWRLRARAPPPRYHPAALCWLVGP